MLEVMELLVADAGARPILSIGAPPIEKEVLASD
jgi:hypothetical protein